MLNSLQSIDTTKKWLTATPLKWEGQPAFWEREAGLLCMGFRALGIESRLVLLGEPRADPNLPLTLGGMNELTSSKWWKQQGAHAVVLYSWGAPRFEPIARAIKASGARLVLRMDSDGINSPRVWFSRYLAATCAAYRDQGHPFAAAAALSFLKSLVFRFVPSSFDRGFLNHLAHADAIIIESPLARQRLLRYLKQVGRPEIGLKLTNIPPQVSDRFNRDPTIQKIPRIMAVGRWDAHQKDARMLIRALGLALAESPTFTAVIAGTGESLLRQHLVRESETIRNRISILGRIDHGRLHRLYQESQIIFFSSRFEGFPNAAAEALCCGCSVVGPGFLASLSYCASEASGTVANQRSAGHLADALGVEMEAWQQKHRNPEAISATWRPRFAVSSVAPEIIRALDLRLSSSQSDGSIK